MPIIPSYQQWLRDTALGVLRPRSSELQAVDEAIRQYERAQTQDNLWKIRHSFDRWKGSKVDPVIDRNRALAITKLEQELNIHANARIHRFSHFSPEEIEAFKFMKRERNKVIKTIFQGKEVTFRNSPKAAKEAVLDAAHNVTAKCGEAKVWLAEHRKHSAAEIAKQSADIAKTKLEELVKSLFQVDTLDSLGMLSGYILEIIGRCGVSIAPVVGHVKDGYDLFTGWAKAAQSLHEQCSISNCRYAIDTGAPAAAFAGLKTCLIEETKNQVASAGIATSSFALKTGLMFADGGAISGPVVGAATAVANLSMQIYGLATEWKATRGINDALQAEQLDINLFKTYPLMGCYLLASATISDVIPIDSFGTPGWMSYIEDLKKRGFDGIYEASNKLIDKSPWEIRGLPKRPNAGQGINTGMILGLVQGANDFGSSVKDFFS